MRRKTDEFGHYYNCPFTGDSGDETCTNCWGIFDEVDNGYEMYKQLDKIRLAYKYIGKYVLNNQKLTKWLYEQAPQ